MHDNDRTTAPDPAQPWEIPVGLDEAGDVVSLFPLIEATVLVGGEEGAGKSSVLQWIVAHAALNPGVEVALFDPLAELRPWQGCATSYVEDDLDQAVEVLSRLQEQVQRRFETLAACSKCKIEEGDGHPLIVVVIDELACYLDVEEASKATAAKAFETALRDLMRNGAAAGIIVVAATRRPFCGDVISASLRDLFSCRWALRCASREASDMILGFGWASRGYCASEIDPAAKGLGYLLAQGAAPIRLTAFCISDKGSIR